MTDDEKLRGVALLSDVGTALTNARFRKGEDLVRMTLALERLARFFDMEIKQETA